MTLQLECAPAPVRTENDDWSKRYAARLTEQLTQIAPDLPVSIQSDSIGLMISGTGWAIHAVRSDASGERYLSLMAMRGMQNSSFELAIRDLCLAMDADRRPNRPESIIGE